MTNRIRLCCTKPVSYCSNGDEVSMLKRDMKCVPFKVFDVENSTFWITRLVNPESGLRYATDEDEFKWQKHIDGVEDVEPVPAKGEPVEAEQDKPKSRKVIKKNKGE